jgi:hypothetical protein
MVLTLEGDRISAITRFTDANILARFALGGRFRPSQA